MYYKKIVTINFRFRNILYAMDRLKVKRIGHGLALARGMTTQRSGVAMSPQDLVKKAKEAGITFEVILLKLLSRYEIYHIVNTFCLRFA